MAPAERGVTNMIAGTNGMIHTVLGQIAPQSLGPTLIHEHMVFGPESGEGWAPLTDRAELIETMARELRAAHKTVGLGCFVDLTATACTRDPLLQRTVAEQSGVNVVACTGFWEGSSYPEWANAASIDELCAVMTRDLCEGIDGTGVRAGVIKVATAKDAITRPEAKVLRAAARVQRDIGAGIITHTGLGTMGWEQLSIFEQEGADLSRVVIGHLDSQTDAGYFEYVLQRGATVAFDRLGRGRPFQPDDAEKADVVAHLVQRGWVDHVVLAHDAARWFTMNGGHRPERPPYTHLFTAFAAMLRQRGVHEEHLRTMVVDNPARILAY